MGETIEKQRAIIQSQRELLENATEGDGRPEGELRQDTLQVFMHETNIHFVAETIRRQQDTIKQQQETIQKLRRMLEKHEEKKRYQQAEESLAAALNLQPESVT